MTAQLTPHRTPQTDQDWPADRAGPDRCRWRESLAAVFGVFHGRDPQSQHAPGLRPGGVAEHVRNSVETRGSPELVVYAAWA